MLFVWGNISMHLKLLLYGKETLLFSNCDEALLLLQLNRPKCVLRTAKSWRSLIACSFHHLQALIASLMIINEIVYIKKYSIQYFMSSRLGQSWLRAFLSLRRISKKVIGTLNVKATQPFHVLARSCAMTARPPQTTGRNSGGGKGGPLLQPRREEREREEGGDNAPPTFAYWRYLCEARLASKGRNCHLFCFSEIW